MGASAREASEKPTTAVRPSAAKPHADQQLRAAGAASASSLSVKRPTATTYRSGPVGDERRSSGPAGRSRCTSTSGAAPANACGQRRAAIEQRRRGPGAATASAPGPRRSISWTNLSAYSCAPCGVDGELVQVQAWPGSSHGGGQLGAGQRAELRVEVAPQERARADVHRRVRPGRAPGRRPAASAASGATGTTASCAPLRPARASSACSPCRGWCG